MIGGNHGTDLTPRGTFTVGPTEPAGYFFWGKPVWRTSISGTTPASSATATIATLDGFGDLVDVWGEVATGGQSYPYTSWNPDTASNNDSMRLRVNPATGDVSLTNATETAAGNTHNYSGSSALFNTKPFTIVVFWTRGA